MKPLPVLAVAAVIACASAVSTNSPGGTSTNTSTSTNIHRNANLINEQEIASISESNAYDVITRLRPDFLRFTSRTYGSLPTSGYAAVFVDGLHFGELASLRNIAANRIHEIGYLNGGIAISKYGTPYGAGVIDVRTK